MGKGIHKGEKIRASMDTIFNEWDEVLEKLQKSEVPLTSSDILSLSEKLNQLKEKKLGSKKYNEAREEIRTEIEKLKEEYGLVEKPKTPEEKSQEITEQINEVGAEIKNEGKEQVGKVEEKLEKTNLGDKKKEEILNEAKEVTKTANSEAQEATEKAQEEKDIFKKCEELESEIRDEKDKRIQRIKESNKIINFNNYKIHFVIVLREHKWLEKSDAREKIEGFLDSVNEEIKKAVIEKNEEIQKATSAEKQPKPPGEEPKIPLKETLKKKELENQEIIKKWEEKEKEKEKEKLEEQPKEKTKETLSQEEVGALLTGLSEEEKAPEQKFVVPEEFEGPEYEGEKKKYDPFFRFVREELKLDPEGFRFEYKAVVALEKDPNNPNKVRGVIKKFSNYHDYLKWRKQLTEEEKAELDGIYGSGQSQWRSPAIFAKNFWKRIEDPQDELHQYKDQIYNLYDKLIKGSLDDDYIKAVESGEVREIIKKEEEEEKLEEEKEEEKKKLTEEQQEEIIKSLGEFGFKGEEIEQAGGIQEMFKGLSYGQSLLVLENLKQITLGKIKESGLDKYKEDVSKSPWYSKMWKVMSKKYQVARKEKGGYDELMGGGMEKHSKVLEKLISGIKETGPEVVINDKKELEIQYISSLDLENLTEEEKKDLEEFNKVATQYSKMPYEWSLDTALKDEQKKYAKAEKEYKEAREKILKIKEKRSGEREALLYINETEKNIKLNQFLNTHPDVQRELGKIKDKKVLAVVTGKIIGERGIYSGLGFLSRTLAISIAGSVGAFAVAPLMGGWLAHRRAGETLREEDKLSRKDKAKKIIKTKAGIQREKSNFADVDTLHERLGEIIKRIEDNNYKELAILEGELKLTGGVVEIKAKKETIEEQKNRDSKHLKRLVNYVEDKLNKGLVNFGGEEKRLDNQYELIKNLSQAKLLTSEAKLEERERKILEKVLKLRDKKISKEKRDFKVKQVVLGASIGAAYAAVGYGIRYLYDIFSGKTVPQYENIGKRSPRLRPLSGEEQPQKPSGPALGPEAPKTVIVNEDYVRLGIVHQGKGVEHALMEQLEKKSQEFGYDPKSGISVKEWASEEAHQLAIKGGYVKFEAGGHQPAIPEQMRVGKADSVAYLLGKDKDGKLVIAEYFKDKKGEWQAGEKHFVADDFKSAKFEGADKEEYEYIKEKEVIAEPPSVENPDIKIQVSEEPDILEKINKGIMTDFEIEQGLKMRNIDINGDGQPEMVNIINRNNNIIGEFEVKSAEDIYEIKKFVSNTLENFEKIQDGKVKISVENVDEAGIKLFDKGGLDESDVDKIKFWISHKDMLMVDKPEIARDYFNISAIIGVKYDQEIFMDTFKRMPINLEDDQKIGYMSIFANPRTGLHLKDDVIKLLGEKVVDPVVGNVEREGGKIIIYDAFSNKGYDILLTKDKVGIDGPAWHNKWLQSGKPTENISSESLKALKGLIGDLKKGLEENLYQKRFE